MRQTLVGLLHVQYAINMSTISHRDVIHSCIKRLDVSFIGAREEWGGGEVEQYGVGQRARMEAGGR